MEKYKIIITEYENRLENMTLEYKACKKELKRERERQSLLADNNDELKRQLDDM